LQPYRDDGAKLALFTRQTLILMAIVYKKLGDKNSKKNQRRLQNGLNVDLFKTLTLFTFQMP
jgi:hypothetical protein